jgi:hypothetical protein
VFHSGVANKKETTNLEYKGKGRARKKKKKSKNRTEGGKDNKSKQKLERCWKRRQTNTKQNQAKKKH